MSLGHELRCKQSGAHDATILSGQADFDPETMDTIYILRWGDFPLIQA